MHVIELTAENVKRIRAVRIKPDPNLQVIGGRNSQGKTSVLDAIWLAVAGGDAARDVKQPVREGQQEARVEVDLGDLIVVREWRHGRSTLKVYDPSGALYPSPQTMLDAVIGQLSFDPLEFTRLDQRKQVTTLLKLADVDLDPAAIATQRQQLFDQRTETGRQVKRLFGHVDTLGAREDVDDTLPSISDLLKQAREASELDAKQQRERDRLADAKRTVEVQEERLRVARMVLEEAARLVDQHVPDPDVAATYAAVSAAERQQEAVARNAERSRAAHLADEAKTEYAALTEQIEALDRMKRDALAGAHMPVDGLSIGDTGVTYNGVPFSQASASEQIRVSLALAMAANPRLRVIRIADGSLLDDDNMKLIEQAAVANDFQVWVERVGTGDERAVIIEDGEVQA